MRRTYRPPNKTASHFGAPAQAGVLFEQKTKHRLMLAKASIHAPYCKRRRLRRLIQTENQNTAVMPPAREGGLVEKAFRSITNTLIHPSFPWPSS
jgi:hypothetical protein